MQGGTIEDLHPYGARARISHINIPLFEDEAILVDFGLNSEPQEVPGRVRWTQQCEDGSLRCGVAFDNILSMKLPLETVAAACARIEDKATRLSQPLPPSLLEGIVDANHPETTTGALLKISAKPAQHVFNTLKSRLELQSLRLQTALSHLREAFPQSMLYPAPATMSQVSQELENAINKIKQCIQYIQLLYGPLSRKTDSRLYRVNTAEAIRGSVTSMEALCAFLGGKMATLSFRIEADELPVLPVRPTDLRLAIDATLLGLMQSALETKGSSIVVRSSGAENWFELRFTHNGFRML